MPVDGLAASDPLGELEVKWMARPSSQEGLTKQGRDRLWLSSWYLCEVAVQLGSGIPLLYFGYKFRSLSLHLTWSLHISVISASHCAGHIFSLKSVPDRC